MMHELISWILVFLVAALSIATISTLLIVVKVYRMHDVRNASGEYAWMFPSSWTDFQRDMLNFQREMAVNQERMVAAITESSQNHLLMSRLLESLVNATLAFDQKINGEINEKSRGR